MRTRYVIYTLPRIIICDVFSLVDWPFGPAICVQPCGVESGELSSYFISISYDNIEFQIGFNI